MGGSIEKVTRSRKFPILEGVGSHFVNKRLRELRLSLNLSQEAIGAQGFVSTPGWVKIENGTRHPSDSLLEKFVNWLEKDGYIRSQEKNILLEELLSLKYMNHLSPFVRRLARSYHETLELMGPLRIAKDPSKPGKKS